ncbi:MAG: uracil-DNA glycosylase [Lachnospiraceae bacterium]|nr:uracil-DNA glycosylase [Lachnospiraceae bacterium]
MAITGAWAEALREEFAKPYYAKLYQTVLREYQTQLVYPPDKDIFNAFTYTPLEDVRVLILGQDPYHEPGQANGLSFSVNPGIRIPPSLQNICKELQSDLGCEIPDNGDLTCWAKQGVMLLNTVLTVRAHQANSHKNIGWEEFTDAAIRALAAQDRPIVFILWGGQARKKKSMITNPKHYVIESVHPSPLSAYNGFFGSRPFSKCNQFLIDNGLTPIDWQIPSLSDSEGTK